MIFSIKSEHFLSRALLLHAPSPFPLRQSRLMFNHNQAKEGAEEEGFSSPPLHSPSCTD